MSQDTATVGKARGLLARILNFFHRDSEEVSQEKPARSPWLGLKLMPAFGSNTWYAWRGSQRAETLSRDIQRSRDVMNQAVRNGGKLVARPEQVQVALASTHEQPASLTLFI